MKRHITICLAAVLLAGMLLGCGNTAPTPTTVAPPTEAPVSTETSSMTTPETEPVRNADDILLAVLSGTYPVMTEFGISQPLGEYLQETYTAFPIAFTLLDMNRDGENEMVLETDSYVATYLVIHLEQDTAYAYPFGVRQLGRLKADGSFAGSNSAFNSLYMTMDFADGTYVNTVIAECEYQEDWFTLDGESCTQAEFEQFSKLWEQQPGPNWIPLAVPETKPTEPPVSDAPYLENIQNADQPIYREPSYDSEYVGTVQFAGVYTIVEECQDGEGNLWGRLKSGAGWVDLTEIRNGGICLSVGIARDAMLEEGFHHFIQDDSEYATSLVLRPAETVWDFRLTQVDISTGEAVLTDPIYTLDQLSPERPLVAQLAFPGDMSAFGILFTDGEGVEHRYVLSISGRNGMPYLYSPD